MAGRRRPSPLGVLFLTVFADLVGFSIIFPLFPEMLRYYLAQEGLAGEGTPGLLGEIVAALRAASGAEGQRATFFTQVLFGGILGSLFSTLQFAFAPFWGRLSDRSGRRPVLLLTIGGIAASYFLWFFSGSFLLLVLSRFLGGVMSGNISVATAAVADVTDERNRARGMGMIGAAFGLGFILGPALGGTLHVLEEATGFSRALAFVPGVNPFSLAAGSAFLLSVWNLYWVATRLGETLAPEARGKAIAARSSNPVKLFRRFPYPGVSRANWVYFIFLLAFAGMEFTLTFLACDRFAYTPRGIAGMFVTIGLIVAAVQGGVVRRVVPRFGEKPVALAGLVLAVPGMAATGVSTNQLAFYGGLGLLSAGSALCMPALTALVSLYAPEHRQGEVLGTFRSLGALSRAVGPVIACGIYWRYGPEWPYLGGAALLLAPVLLALALPPVRRQAP